MTRSDIIQITAAVRDVLREDLRAIHGRIDDIDRKMATVEERTRHLATKNEVIQAINAHATSCAAGRRWMWGIALGLPAVAGAIWGIVSAISG